MQDKDTWEMQIQHGKWLWTPLRISDWKNWSPLGQSGGYQYAIVWNKLEETVIWRRKL